MHCLEFNLTLLFLLQYIVVNEKQVPVIEGLFIPGCNDCTSKARKQAVGIVGAVIMPHNFYLHSALVKVRDYVLSLYV